jgi:hypothetical protein
MWHMSVRGLSTTVSLKRMFYHRLAFRRCTFQISVGTPFTPTEVFHYHPEPSQANVSTLPQLWHNCFFPTDFQFISIHLSSYPLTLYSINTKRIIYWILFPSNTTTYQLPYSHVNVRNWVYWWYNFVTISLHVSFRGTIFRRYLD